MRTLVLALGLLLSSAAAGLPTAAVAAEKADNSSVAAKLSRIMLPKSTWDQMLEAIEASQLQMIEQVARGADAEAGKKAMAKARESIARIMPYEEMIDLQAGLLAKYYTAAELQELVKFYGSPLGKKSLQLAPEMMKDVMGVLQERMMRELPRLTNEIMQELGAGAQR